MFTKENNCTTVTACVFLLEDRDHHTNLFPEKTTQDYSASGRKDGGVKKNSYSEKMAHKRPITLDEGKEEYKPPDPVLEAIKLRWES